MTTIGKPTSLIKGMNCSIQDTSFQIGFYKRKATYEKAASKLVNQGIKPVTRFHIQLHYAQQGELLSG